MLGGRARVGRARALLGFFAGLGLAFTGAGAVRAAPRAAPASGSRGAGTTHATSPPRRAAFDPFAALAAARGFDRYAALRAVWQAWDEVDPERVEEAIGDVARDPHESAPVRAYAAMLEAYARRRRGDLDGAKRRIHDLGFIERWLVIGPFDNEGKSGFTTAFGPENDLGRPVDTSRGYEGKERQVRWRTVPDVYPYGWLDFGDLVRPTENVCAYATTFVRSRSGRSAILEWERDLLGRCLPRARRRPSGYFGGAPAGAQPADREGLRR